MKINAWLIRISAVLALVGFWQRDALPRDIPLAQALADEPLQRPTSRAPFAASWDGKAYVVEPEYDYDISGLIVSFRHHDGNSRMHRRASDQLNMLDVCVVWGDSADNPYLNRIDFWSGIFTCNFQTRDREAWKAFNVNQISNNHLISDDPDIRTAVQSIRIGDQIRVRGSLASYVSPGGGRRGTSTTRTDTGNGACETIYVDAFEIIRRGVSPWRWLMYGALAVLLASLTVYFVRPHRPHRQR